MKGSASGTMDGIAAGANLGGSTGGPSYGIVVHAEVHMFPAGDDPRARSLRAKSRYVCWIIAKG